MGILGEFVETATRQTIQMLGVAAFLIGIACFLGSKWIEQPGIRLGADAVKSLLDNTINPAYERNPYKIRYAVRRDGPPLCCICCCYSIDTVTLSTLFWCALPPALLLADCRNGAEEEGHPRRQGVCGPAGDHDLGLEVRELRWRSGGLARAGDTLVAGVRGAIRPESCGCTQVATATRSESSVGLNIFCDCI